MIKQLIPRVQTLSDFPQWFLEYEHSMNILKFILSDNERISIFLDDLQNPPKRFVIFMVSNNKYEVEYEDTKKMCQNCIQDAITKDYKILVVYDRQNKKRMHFDQEITITLTDNP